ncbi:hypothetical protein ACS0TY_030293 [Phlomoides rotata]
MARKQLLLTFLLACAVFFVVSVKSLIDMYAAICKVFESLIEHSQSGKSKTEVQGFLEEIKVFCLKNDIDVPNLDYPYKVGRSYRKTTIEHHYHFEVFSGAIDYILMELNTRFNDVYVELLSLSMALDPKKSFESFNNDDICKLAKKLYPGEFTDQDIVSLEYELIHYKHDVIMK